MGYYNSYLFDKAITWTTNGIYAGDVNYRDEKFYCTNVCGVLLNNDGYINLCNAISINKVSKKHVTKVGNPKLMNNVMKEILFSYSNNLKEQTNISIIFDNINSLITLHQRELKILKIFKKSLFVKMIVGKNLTILLATLTKMTNVWEQERLGNVTLLNKYKQYSASFLEKIRKDFGPIKLLPSSINYDWFTDFVNAENKYNNSEVITLGRARNANTKYWKGLFISSNNHIIESYDKNIIENYFLYWIIKVNEKKFYSEETTYPHFVIQDFNGLVFFFPIRIEQLKIISLINNISSLITLHQRELKILKIIKKSLFVKMIVGKNLTILPATLTKMTNVWEQERLGNVTLLNKYKQYSASFLEKIRKDFGPIKLLPSSINYDWFTDFVNAENKYNNSEVITLGRARNANTKYWKGLFISSNNHIIESYDKNIIENYFLYWIIKVNEKKFYSEETTYPHFVIQDFNGLVFFFPIRIEQLKIISLINNISSLITLHQREDSQSLNQGCLVILIVNIGKLHLCILVFYLLS
ncbi:restriction endonuclease subunit S [Mycoplasmopsis cynos]|uniref:restriction endonuclease subunit S n=1 Tax=Mycoplasmopsis cynos TaxID=171284 RepID=UPI0030CC2CED